MNQILLIDVIERVFTSFVWTILMILLKKVAKWRNGKDFRYEIQFKLIQDDFLFANEKQT